METFFNLENLDKILNESETLLRGFLTESMDRKEIEQKFSSLQISSLAATLLTLKKLKTIEETQNLLIDALAALIRTQNSHKKSEETS